jgi:serine phosphatase RsbU (regulator of sigma subunit)
LVSRVFDAIDAFAGDAPQFDDITMLVVRRLGPP